MVALTRCPYLQIHAAAAPDSDCENIRTGGSTLIRGHIRFLSTVLLFWFAQYIFTPFFMPHLSFLEITASVAGFISSIYGLSQLLLRIPFGVCADRFRSHKFFMFLGFLLLGVSGLLLYSATHPAILALARFFSGTSAATWVSFTVFFANRFPEEKTDKAIGTILMVNNLGMLLSCGVGTLLFEQMGIQRFFLISSFVSAAGAVLVISLPEKQTQKSTPITLKSILFTIKNKNLLFHSLLAALYQAVIFATVMAFTANYAKDLGATGFQQGMLMICFNGIAVLTSYWIITDTGRKISDRTKIFFSFMLIVIYCIMIPSCSNITEIYVAQLLSGIGRAIILSLTMGRSLSQIPGPLKSTAMGTYQSIYSIGMTLGPLLMGFSLDYTGSYKISYYLFALLSVGGMVWGLMAAKEKKEILRA